MLTLQGLTALINDESRKVHDDIIKRRDVYYGMSLHIDGACPMWSYLRDNRLGWVQGNWVEKRPLVGWYGIEYQWIFDSILFNRYPNEKEVTRQWRFSTYKPFQKRFFGKAISMTTGAIFQDSGYSLTLADKDDNDYIWGNNFVVGENNAKSNLVNYFASHFKSIAEDPNGYFLVIPKEPANNTTSARIEPDVWFICSKHIEHVTQDELVFKRDGYIWAVNRFGYFRWKRNEDKKAWELVEPNGYYGHMLGYIPAFVAGGTWNTQGFYESWLSDGKAIADDYVIIKSDEAMCAKQASHPWIIEASEDCPQCNHGQIQMCGGCSRASQNCTCEGEISAAPYLATCQNCDGHGNISHNPGDRLIAPKEDMERALIQVVNIPVDANEMHAERAKRAEEELQKALYLDYIDQAQSAVAKAKDQMVRQHYFTNVANDYFDRLLTGACNAITAIRNITVSGGVIRPTPTDIIIVKPSQFEVKTTFDLLEEMKAAKDNNIPSFQYGALLEDYSDKQFGGNEYLKKKTSIINQMDMLANRTAADISVIVLNNAATNRDWQFNMVLPGILDTIRRNWGDERFLEADYDAIKAEVDSIFSSQFPVIPVVALDNTEERVNV